MPLRRMRPEPSARTVVAMVGSASGIAATPRPTAVLIAGTSPHAPPHGEAEHHAADGRGADGHGRAQRVQVALQRGRRRLRGPREQPQLPVHRAIASLDDDRRAVAADHGRPAVDHVRALGQRLALSHAARRLLDRTRLAGERRLLDAEAFGADQPRVGRHRIAVLKQEHVARYQVVGVDHLVLAVTPHARPQRDPPAQGADRPPAAALGARADHGVGEEHAGDEGGFQEGTRGQRQHRASAEERARRVLELVDEQLEEGSLPLRQAVGPPASAPLRDLAIAQAAGRLDVQLPRDGLGGERVPGRARRIGDRHGGDAGQHVAPLLGR